jgi:hypothetical protein
MARDYWQAAQRNNPRPAATDDDLCDLIADQFGGPSIKLWADVAQDHPQSSDEELQELVLRAWLVPHPAMRGEPASTLWLFFTTGGALVAGAFAVALAKELGTKTAQAIAALISESRVGRCLSPKTMVMLTMDLPDDAYLALAELDIGDNAYKGKRLTWDAATSRWIAAK